VTVCMIEGCRRSKEHPIWFRGGWLCNRHYGKVRRKRRKVYERLQAEQERAMRSFFSQMLYADQGRINRIWASIWREARRKSSRKITFTFRRGATADIKMAVPHYGEICVDVNTFQLYMGDGARRVSELPPCGEVPEYCRDLYKPSQDK